MNINPKDNPLFLKTLEYHMQNPEISLKEHLKNRVVELGEEVLRYKRVYLDLNFWIYLQKASFGRPEKIEHLELYKILVKAVDDGKILCPISQPIFLELLKQSDETTRVPMFKMMEQLSKGVTIQTEDERRSTEIVHFLKQNTLGSKSIYPLEQLVWTKIPYVLGYHYPDNEVAPKEQMLLIQKAFTDWLWTCSLEEIPEIFKKTNRFHLIEMTPVSDKINQGKFAHADQINSYKKAFMVELVGILDLYKPRMNDIWCEMYKNETGKDISVEDKNFLLKSSSDPLGALILLAFEKNRITTQLPTWRVGTSLHAMYRWDRNRKLKPNDLYDFDHAKAALPYFDYFFTERSLKNLVTTKQLSLDKIYSTQVVSDEKEAIEVLSKL